MPSIDAPTSAGPTGPLVSSARPIDAQKAAAAGLDGPFDNRHKADWPIRTQRQSVASVVASFDSATMIGAVDATRAAQRRRAGAEHRAGQHPDPEARQRAGEGRG